MGTSKIYDSSAAFRFEVPGFISPLAVQGLQIGGTRRKRSSMQLKNRKIAILATNGFEQLELEVPRDKLKAAGATVHVVSLKAGEIKGWDKKDWDGQSRSTRHSVKFPPTNTMRSCCRAARSIPTC